MQSQWPAPRETQRLFALVASCLQPGSIMLPDNPVATLAFVIQNAKCACQHFENNKLRFPCFFACDMTWWACSSCVHVLPCCMLHGLALRNSTMSTLLFCKVTAISIINGFFCNAWNCQLSDGYPLPIHLSLITSMSTIMIMWHCFIMGWCWWELWSRLERVWNRNSTKANRYQLIPSMCTFILSCYGVLLYWHRLIGKKCHNCAMMTLTIVIHWRTHMYPLWVFIISPSTLSATDT